MTKTITRIICALMCLALLFGCTEGSGGNQESGSENGGSGREQSFSDYGTGRETEFTKLFERGIVRANNLTENEVEVDDTCSYIVLSGLADKEIENKINARILEVFNQMYNMTYIPPYRGIALKQKQFDFSSFEKYINCYSVANVNNLLSIQMYASYSTSSDNDTDEYFNFNYYVYLNYDLTTGEELRLSDLFDKDTDYITLLNECVFEQIQKSEYDHEDDSEYYEFDPLMLTAPFVTIKPDQKFSFDNNGQIELLFDYDAPEFYTCFSSQMVGCDKPEGLVLSAKSDKEIFESDKKTYNLVRAWYNQLDSVRESGSFAEEEKDGYNYWWNYGLNKNYPQNIQDTVVQLASDKNAVPIDEIVSDCTNASDGGKWSLYANNSVYSNSLIGYYNIEQRIEAQGFVYDQFGNDQILYNSSKLILRCYKEGSSEPMTLDDLFVDGVDAAGQIKNAIYSRYERRYPHLHREVLDYLVERYLPQISGFALGSGSISLSYDTNTYNEIADSAGDFMTDKGEEVYTFDDIDNNYEYNGLLMDVDYEDLDCSTLTIFQ